MKRFGVFLIAFGVVLYLATGSPAFSNVIAGLFFFSAAVLVTAGILVIMYSRKDKQEPPAVPPCNPAPDDLNTRQNEPVPEPQPASPPEPVPDPQPSPEPAPLAAPLAPFSPIVQPLTPRLTYTPFPSSLPLVFGSHDYCVLDVETTGLHRETDRIIQIGIIKLQNDTPVSILNTYVNPERHIPSGATKINGITDDDVIDAPKYSDIADQVASFFGDSPVIGHNVTFDLKFVQDLLLFTSDPDLSVSVQYIDTLKYARQLLPQLPDHKLQTLLEYYEIDPGNAHTAYDDAAATLSLFQALREEYRRQDAMEKAERKRKREEEAAARRRTFSASPLLDQKICFTGSFSLDRESMEKMAFSVGALVQDKGPSRNTAYLVKGDVSGLPEWALDRKLRKAEALVASGKPVMIINESDYFQLIAGAKDALDSSAEGVET